MSVATHIAPTGVREAFEALLAYCRANDWAGYDPYDALNSSCSPRCRAELQAAAPGADAGAEAQPDQPPAAAADSADAEPQGHGALPGRVAEGRSRRRAAVDDLPALMIGADRPAVARHALLVLGLQLSVADPHARGPARDAQPGVHDVCRQRSARRVRAARRRRCLTMALSAADYILNELYRTGGRLAGFSYPLPSMGGSIHNANFLGAALLCRVYRLPATPVAGSRAEGRPILRLAANAKTARGRTARPTAALDRQLSHRLQPVRPARSRPRSRDDRVRAACPTGLEFYRTHFFREDGAPGISTTAPIRSISIASRRASSRSSRSKRRPRQRATRASVLIGR